MMTLNRICFTTIAFFCITLSYSQAKKTHFFKTNAIIAKVTLNKDSRELPLNEIPNPFDYGIPKRTVLKFVLPEDSLNIVMMDNVHIEIHRIDIKDTLRINFNSVEVANFDDDFRNKNRGKVNIAIPEVYELMNVLIALTPSGIKDKGLVYHESTYYPKVQTFFDAFKSHSAVYTIDSLLKKEYYHQLKMDSYSFVFDKNSKLIGNKNYQVINWNNINSITPDLITSINDFVQKTDFRKFYAQNKPFYNEQITFYKSKVNIKQMTNWLKKNFPAKSFDYFNIIFSPLVYGNQSTRQFEDNNFTEAQVHVNFPYFDKEREAEIPKSYNLFRGNILFTELNHNFINPETDKHEKLIKGILTDLTLWAEKGKPAQFGYRNAKSCFNEYMNWALVSLYLYDYADPSEFNNIVLKLDNFMQDYRGFKQFRAFNHFLIDKYKHKPANMTVADLYPDIISWFKENNK